MTWSVTEIAALLSKAARGAGAPAAQAARFGQAGAIHLAKGRDRLEIDTALEALPEGPILSVPLMVDTALIEGTPLKGARNTLTASYAETLSFVVTLDGDTVRINSARPKPTPQLERIKAEATWIERLNALAARTFVPESEASRHSGAGAGLSDND